MAPPTQKNRFLSIDTQLGTDKLLLRHFSMTEKIGRLFEIEVEMDSTDSSISFEKIVGTSATVTLTMPNGQDRYFNGIVSRFVQEQQGTLPIYRATLSPWLWLLTRTSDCAIFQNMNVPDIIEAIFKGQGFTDYKLKLNASYNPREYCVQYRESDFNFVSRLMEQEGIYYYFQHQDGKHILTLVDSASAHDTFPGYDTLTYRPATGKDEQKEAVTDWIIEKELQSGLYTMGDFNFETPKVDVSGNANITRTHQNASLDVFDYPGGFGKATDGEAYAKLRIQELQAQYELLRGEASVRGVATGYKFTLKGHPRSDQGRQYLVIGTKVEAKAGAYASGQAGGGDFFSCKLTAMPATQQYRTPRTTPKPLIRGPQTAIVTGPSGQEINTDTYGRVSVQFHWDRPDHDNNQSQQKNTSCMIRVAQVWAGKQWGAVYIPRIGQEVVVEFLEGDPDRPIITGSVFNADQMPPYALPANQTQSGIISRSTTGGSSANFNTLWFEDKKGSELVTFQAEKDLSINIKNNRTEAIGADRSETVSGGHTETISKDRSLTVKGKETKEVDGDVTDTFKGALSQTVSNDVTQNFNGALSLTVAKDVTDTFQGALTQTVSKDVTQTFQGGHTEQTTKAYSLQADTVSITGQTKVTLTVGTSSITIDSSSVTISAQNITVSAQVGLTLKANATLEASASGQTTIKGAMVMIN